MNVPQPATTGGSSSVLTSSDVFSNQDSLLNLLVAIRGSTLPSEVKMVARDAVLDYSQQKDETAKEKIKTDIISILSPYQKEFPPVLFSSQAPTPVSEKKEESLKIAVKSGLGLSRPIPVFTPKTVTKSDTKKEVEQTVVEKEKVVPPEQAQPPTSPGTETPADEPAPTPKVETESKPVDNKPATLDAYLERIKEIKRSVNEKVGNPINLIDTNNDIGREYMNSLLDAMKRTSGAGTGAGEAMDRLELAFLKVQELISTGQVGAQVTAKNTPATAKKEPTAKETKVENNAEPEAEPEKAVKVAVKTQSVPTNQSAVKPELKTVQKTADTPLPVTLDNLKEELSKTKLDTPQSVGRIKSVAEIAREPITKNETASSPQADPAAVKPGTSDFWSRLTSKNSKSEPTNTPTPESSQPTTKESVPKKQVPVSADAMKIDAGLNQLLSEWKLFKSSGFLGTGPNGINHPLYKSLANLPMAAVISGRFEGSDPEVKQSITDYMNGWRYEQGIVHEMNETFEQYLRRVIAHILERQKDKTEA